jgi:hypothetical protein
MVPVGGRKPPLWPLRLLVYITACAASNRAAQGVVDVLPTKVGARRERCSAVAPTVPECVRLPFSLRRVSILFSRLVFRYDKRYKQGAVSGLAKGSFCQKSAFVVVRRGLAHETRSR